MNNDVLNNKMELKKLSNEEKNSTNKIEIFKEADFSDVFGTLKTKTTGQEFKKEVKNQLY